MSADPTYEELELMVERVRELHTSQVLTDKNGKLFETGFCEHCVEHTTGQNDVLLPCPTLKALDGEDD